MITSITFDDISPIYLTASKLKYLINFLDDVNINCTFFVVPYEKKLHFLETEEFVSCLKAALDKGHELALHGYRHTKNEFGCLYPIPLQIPFPTLKKQKERLEKSLSRMMDFIGIRVTGFRAPYYMYNSVTLKALSCLGFKYDSSATIFKPAHSINLRIRWLHNCKPFVKFGVVEIPVSGDYTYSLKSNNFYISLRKALRDFEWIESRKGVFVLNNHPQKLNNISLRFLRTLINMLSKKTEFLRLCDVSKLYS